LTGPKFTANLAPGIHTLMVAPTNAQTEKLELADTPNSPAKAQIVTGR
jgi:hypothetical protein